MNKFQKLSQLNKDIELLENAGKLKAAEILHKKFIREAQYAMPQYMTTMMPQTFIPQVAPMMSQMFARPAMPIVPTVVPKPVVNPQAVSASPATTTTAPTPVPASGQVNPSGIKPGTPPSSLTRNTNQQGQAGYVQNQNGTITIFGQDGNPISYVAPPGSTVGPGLKDGNPGLPPGYQPPVSKITPPSQIQQQVYDHYGGKLTKRISEIDDPQKLQEVYKKIRDQIEKEKKQGRLTQDQIDQLLEQMQGR